MRRKKRTAVFNILIDLNPEILKAVEFLLFSQMSEKIHDNLPAVQVTGKTRCKCLNRPRIALSDRRICSDVVIRLITRVFNLLSAL